jgi:sugar lactone lactonase YvrE
MKIKVGDWDDKTGNVTNIGTLVNMIKYGRFRKNVPYGMNMDKNGNIYVAMFGGGKIFRLNTR